MNGWNTQHQEFTLAKGDPNKINELISEFKLEGIVSFDKVNSLITTTLIHHRFIRLSDLLTLNISKVIAFTLPQYLQVIRQLFELLQGMKQLQIQHGDLRMENILLDLTSSSDKLDNKPIEVMFQIKLINFAQFYNVKMEDDFERGYQIYRQITEYFPKYFDYLELQKLYEFKQEAIFLDHLQDQIKLSIQFNIDQGYYWDSNGIFQNYMEQQPNKFNEIERLIQQLHQYHLIVNHYAKLNYSFLAINFKFNCQHEPQNFEQAVLQLNQALDYDNLTNRINFKYFEILEEQNILNLAIKRYQSTIQEVLLCYLKKQGYLENINKFVELIQNIDQISNFIEYQFFKQLDDYSSKCQIFKTIKVISFKTKI